MEVVITVADGRFTGTTGEATGTAIAGTDGARLRVRLVWLPLVALASASCASALLRRMVKPVSG